MTQTQFPLNLPLPLMLLTAPILGLLFVMFLPLIGFVMMLRLLGTVAYRHTVVPLCRVLTPSWTPVWAFLHRSRPAAPTTDAWSERMNDRLNK